MDMPCIQADAGNGIDDNLCPEVASPQPNLSFLSYFMANGVLLLASGPLAAIVTSVLFMKNKHHDSNGSSRAVDASAPSLRGSDATGSDPAVSGVDEEEEEEEEDAWPLETFGVHILPGLRPGFIVFESWLRDRLMLISSTIMAAFVCGPAVAYFMLRAFVARFDRKVSGFLHSKGSRPFSEAM